MPRNSQFNFRTHEKVLIDYKEAVKQRIESGELPAGTSVSSELEKFMIAEVAAHKK